MKLDEIYEPEGQKEKAGPQDYKIFCDMDGVLVDFIRGVKELIDDDYSEEAYDRDPKVRKRMWDAVKKYSKGDGDFWLELEEMPDARVLWDYIKVHDPEILTATGHSVKTAGDQKKEWIVDHLGSDIKVNVVAESGEKGPKFAGDNRILIDDKKKSIDPWVKAGGIGILHTSAANTIKQLKELGI